MLRTFILILILGGLSCLGCQNSQDGNTSSWNPWAQKKEPDFRTVDEFVGAERVNF